MATLTVYPDAGTGGTTVDGNVTAQYTNVVFSTLRTNAGTAADDVGTEDPIARLQAGTTSNRFNIITRGIFTFDTSALTSGATLSAAVLSLYGRDSTTGLGSGYEVDIVASTPAANNALANADYGQLGTTVFSSIAYASLHASFGVDEAYNDFTLDANGIANISKTGISKFGSRINWDTDNSFGGAWANSQSSQVGVWLADESGTSKDPKLVITYAVSNLKSYNTNVVANIKSIDTNLIANVKSLNTNTNA